VMLMRNLTLTFVTALMLTTSAVQSAPRDDKSNILRALATSIGRLLGAASSCQSIAKPRVAAVREKITNVLTGSAASQDEGAALLKVFEASQKEGITFLTQGQTTCATTERDLADLENASQTQAQTQTQAPSTQINTMTPPKQLETQIATASPSTAIAVRGISDSEIRFGIAAPFSGPSRDLGNGMQRGIEIAFRSQNELGGINGRMLRLVMADD